MNDKNDKRYPQKGAGRKWAARLKELGERPPLKELTDKINELGEKRKEKERAASVTHSSHIFSEEGSG